MTAIRTVALIIILLVLETNAYGAEPSVNEILKKVAVTYEAMNTYKAEGTISKGQERNGNRMWGKFSFSIIMKKPNLYLINWTQTNLKPKEVSSYTVWSDGDQPYIYMESFNFFSKLTGDDHALREVGRYMGIIIPSLFMSVFKEHEAPFSWLKDPKIEKIGGEDCYLISGSSELSKREAIWVSKSSYLIMQYYQSPDYIKRHKLIMETPGMTDEEKTRHIEAVEIIKRSKLTSFSIETNTAISFPELKKDDFNFVLPKNAVQRDKWFRD